MDISPITDEHYNRTSHGSHPLLQMKQCYNSAKRLESEMESEEIQESQEKQQLS